jgi:hypothetical protein
VLALSCPTFAAEASAVAPVALAVLKFAGADGDGADECARLVVAEVEGAEPAGAELAVAGALVVVAVGAGAWVVGVAWAAFGVDADDAAPAAGCAVLEGGELVAALGLVVGAEATLGGGGWH